MCSPDTDFIMRGKNCTSKDLKEWLPTDRTTLFFEKSIYEKEFYFTDLNISSFTLTTSYP